MCEFKFKVCVCVLWHVIAAMGAVIVCSVIPLCLLSNEKCVDPGAISNDRKPCPQFNAKLVITRFELTIFMSHYLLLYSVAML